MTLPTSNDTNDPLLSSVQLFFGDANDAVARIYARLALNDPSPGESFCLTGVVSGPACAYATTLPARIPFRSKEPGTTLLAEAVVPDPCFWSPELPFLYRARIELRRENEVIAVEERLFGIRRLGASDRHLYFDAKRYVIRAVATESAAERDSERASATDLSPWRAADAAMLVENPPDEFCHRASEHGILLLAQLSEKSSDIRREILRLARWPAVGVVVLKDMLKGGENESMLSYPTGSLRSAAGNLLLAQWQTAEQRNTTPLAEWADLVVTQASGDLAAFAEPLNAAIPEIVVRCLAESADVATARAGCDRLQRDLAARGDFAGYVV